jgi:hypothetical protein
MYENFANSVVNHTKADLVWISCKLSETVFCSSVKLSLNYACHYKSLTSVRATLYYFKLYMCDL